MKFHNLLRKCCVLTKAYLQIMEYLIPTIGQTKIRICTVNKSDGDLIYGYIHTVKSFNCWFFVLLETQVSEKIMKLPFATI